MRPELDLSKIVMQRAVLDDRNLTQEEKGVLTECLERYYQAMNGLKEQALPKDQELPELNLSQPFCETSVKIMMSQTLSKEVKQLACSMLSLTNIYKQNLWR
jgi:aminoglycoside phosphotransferase (APT) family kinase protein